MATDRLSLLVYRTLLLATAAVALAAGVGVGLGAVDVAPAFQLTEYWRAYGLLVFAALFAHLGLAPPGAAVLWLVVVFHKAAMTMTAVLLLRHDVAGAPLAAVVDGALVLVTLAALGLRRSAARSVQGAAVQDAAATARTLAAAHSVHVPHSTASSARLTPVQPSW
jgi:hypothetical protein